MAGDIRETNQNPIQQDSASAPVPQVNVKSPNSHQAFNGPSNVNILLNNSGQNIASSKSETPTLAEAAKTVRVGDFKQIHKYPCTRDALLTGIGGGFGIGSIRLVFGGTIFSHRLLS
jgi:cytochrome c oxidase assembly protein subunit 20